MATDRKVRRCAVYTRKSSEEGLEQDFNSLHAQREACEAFIKSQRGEGWHLVAKAYADGGLSGGNMERPALQRLLADIEAGLVDVVVVYKVDRLTRSLADFAKMVEVFDRQGVSFVAVTQQFNTTTSMGRLTLNVLLSFAQFEREVTGERIRDKIAASKKKGMWMGGRVPLGYAVNERKLVIVPEEAEAVRKIFQQFLKVSGVRELSFELRRRGIRSKTRSGQPGGWLSRGALYALLSNPLYRGQVRHKETTYPGQHEAIIDSALWDQVREKLKDHTVRSSSRGRKTDPSPLLGKLVDERGKTLTPSHAIKKGRRYRYYVSQTADSSDDASSWRLPAREVEGRVAEVVSAMLEDRPAIAQAALAAGLAERDLPETLDRVGESLSRLDLVQRVRLSGSGLAVTLAIPGKMPIRLERTVPAQMKRRGVERKLVITSPKIERASVSDSSLTDTIGRALKWWDMLTSGEVSSIEDLAKKVGLAGQTVGRIVPLALLAPDIIEAVAEGRQPVQLTTKALLHEIDLPMAWEEQRAALGFE